ncbi:unnamed protein product [Sphenostylis stenocarpa]|uniref:HMA domain-containing protein n=1 Tax=Sphenostylis stenocarpa TaxID=92480 RepID=A0AA86W2K0_9FABA|nr:unnamed protein product [Sphenostylis stenocarpa]
MGLGEKGHGPQGLGGCKVKVVLKVEVHEDKIKKKAMKTVSGTAGVESVSVDMKDKKWTLIGDIDPVQVVAKLRKFSNTEIVSVGPAKEEKKQEPKKDDKKMEDGRKDSTKGKMPDPLTVYQTSIEKKVVLKVEVHEDKIKKKAMKTVSGIAGVESVSMDMKDQKLTLTGDIDAVRVVAKLRKFCHTEIVSVGPAKEEKKEEPKKDDKKKDDDKKDSKKEIVPDPLKFYQNYAYYYQTKPQYNPYYSAISVEEDPNGCVIV